MLSMSENKIQRIIHFSFSLKKKTLTKRNKSLYLIALAIKMQEIIVNKKLKDNNKQGFFPKMKLDK